MINSHGHVEVEVRIHAQDRLDLSVRPFSADHRHVISSLRCRQQLPPDEQERTDDTVTSHAEASSYEVTTLLRLRVAVGRHQGIRSTSHLQGTFGSRGRRVRPPRGVAHSHPPGYSQRGRIILRSPYLAFCMDRLVGPTEDPLPRSYAWKSTLHVL